MESDVTLAGMDSPFSGVGDGALEGLTTWVESGFRVEANGSDGS